MFASSAIGQITILKPKQTTKSEATPLPRSCWKNSVRAGWNDYWGKESSESHAKLDFQKSLKLHQLPSGVSGLLLRLLSLGTEACAMRHCFWSINCHTWWQSISFPRDLITPIRRSLSPLPASHINRSRCSVLHGWAAWTGRASGTITGNENINQNEEPSDCNSKLNCRRAILASPSQSRGTKKGTVGAV